MLEDILRDTWFYQKILREGNERGLEKGLEKGREEEQKEITQKLRLEMLKVIQVRFPDIVELTRQKIEEMQDPILLYKLNNDIIMAKSSKEAEQVLRNFEGS